MSLTPAQKAAREGKLTGSRVGVLMNGDERQILNLWREMVGDPDYVAEDLDDYWPAVLGSFTEQLQLDWYERCTGHRVTRRGEVVISPRAEWAAVTLDGWDDVIGRPIECKHVGGYERREVVIGRYQPQYHWEMVATDTPDLRSSIIEGAKEPVVEIVPFDRDYGEELWRRAETFMKFVETLSPPVVLPSIPPPVIPVQTYQMTGSNEWAALASDWLTHNDAAKKFDAAEKELKALVPADARIAWGHGITAVRNKAGSVRIKENAA